MAEGIDGSGVDWSQVERLEASLMDGITADIGRETPGLTWDNLQALLQKVYDEAYKPVVDPAMFEGMRRERERLATVYDPSRLQPYDTNNPLHYVARYGMQGRPLGLEIKVDYTGVAQEARLREIIETGRRRAKALFTGDAGDIVSDVISRDEHGRFIVEEDTTPIEPASEVASEAESEAQAVNLDPQ